MISRYTAPCELYPCSYAVEPQNLFLLSNYHCLHWPMHSIPTLCSLQPLLLTHLFCSQQLWDFMGVILLSVLDLISFTVFQSHPWCWKWLDFIFSWLHNSPLSTRTTLLCWWTLKLTPHHPASVNTAVGDGSAVSPNKLSFLCCIYWWHIPSQIDNILRISCHCSVFLHFVARWERVVAHNHLTSAEAAQGISHI